MKGRSEMNANTTTRWISFGVLFFLVFIAGQALMAAGDPLAIDVRVDQMPKAGIGFDHLSEEKVYDLTVNLKVVNPKQIQFSRVIEQEGRIIFSPPKRTTAALQHSYLAAGVKSNYGHAAKFEGTFTKVGGAGGPGQFKPDFESLLSDLDMDMDSNNNGAAATKRLPDRGDGEDYVEYVTVNNNPSTTVGLHAKQNEIIAAKMTLRKKKAGTLAVAGGTFFSDAALQNPINWNNEQENLGQLTAYMQVTQSTVITSTFTPEVQGGRKGPGADNTGKTVDKLNIILDGATGAVFNPNPVITGYKLKNGGTTLDPRKIKQTVTCTITPAEDAPGVTIRIADTAGKNRIELGDISGPTGGVFTFDVFGKDATPVDSPYGDTTIEAVKGGNVIGSVQVIVVKPKRIGYPHPAPKGPVQPINKVLDSNSTPPLFPPPNTVVLATLYMHLLEIHVEDQFGNQLDNIYVGSEIEEFMPDLLDIKPINVAICEGGVYTDHVGGMMTRTVAATSPEVQTWPNADPVPLTDKPPTRQDILVYVGGHPLNPSVVNRIVKCIAPNKVDINW
jgi:hypothetical protein